MHLTPDVGILVAQIALMLVVLGVAVALVRVIVNLCARSKPG